MKDLISSTVTEVTLGYVNPIPFSQMRKISNSKDSYDIFVDVCFRMDEISLFESFHMLMLNKANKVLGYKLISQGGCSGTIVDPKLVFMTALKCAAASIILAHYVK